MIRVVHVITKLELGGAQENTLYTLGHLDRSRFSGLLLTNPEGLLVADAVGDARYETRFVPSLVREVRPHRDAAALAELVAALRREMRAARAGGGARRVIVHTHSSKAGILGRAAARLAGVPAVIHSIHGYGFHPRQRPAVRRLYVGLERLAARWTTHFIAVAQADIEEGVALGLFPRERATLIRSGIDIAAYAGAGVDRAATARELGFDPAQPLVGMVACLKPQKNPVDFVRVAGVVAGAVPTAQFLLAGDGVLAGGRGGGAPARAGRSLPAAGLAPRRAAHPPLPRRARPDVALGRAAARVPAGHGRRQADRRLSRGRRPGGGGGGSERLPCGSRRRRGGRRTDRRTAQGPGARAADGGGRQGAGRGVRRGPDGAAAGGAVRTACRHGDRTRLAEGWREGGG